MPPLEVYQLLIICYANRQSALANGHEGYLDAEDGTDTQYA